VSGGGDVGRRLSGKSLMGVYCLQGDHVRGGGRSAPGGGRSAIHKGEDLGLEKVRVRENRSLSVPYLSEGAGGGSGAWAKAALEVADGFLKRALPAVRCKGMGTGLTSEKGSGL